MLSFNDFLHSRKSNLGTLEHFQRSKSVGHGAAHSLLQQPDELKLQRSSTVNNRQQLQQPGGSVASGTAIQPAQVHGLASSSFTRPQSPFQDAAMQQQFVGSAAAASANAQQQQALSATSSRIQLLQEQLLSRSNSRRASQQHTVTTISSAGPSGAASRIASRSQSLKQLLMSRQASVAANRSSTAPAAAGSASSPNSPRLRLSTVQPMSLADALLSPGTTSSLSRRAADSSSHTTPTTPQGRAYASRALHAERPAAAAGTPEHVHFADGFVEQQLHAVSRQQSSQSAASTANQSTSQQLDHHQDQRPTEQQAASSSKIAALQSLQQQQQQLQQMVRLQSIRQLQQQASKLSRMSSAQSRSPDVTAAAVAFEGTRSQLSRAVSAHSPPHAADLATNMPGANSTAPGQGVQQLQQQSSQVQGSYDSAIDVLASRRAAAPAAVTFEATGGPVSAAARSDGSPTTQQSVQPIAEHLQQPGQVPAGLDSEVIAPAEGYSQKQAAAAIAVADAAEAQSISSEQSSPSAGGAFLSPETTDSGQEYFKTPAYKQQYQHSSRRAHHHSHIQQQVSFTASDVSATLSDDDCHSRQLKRGSAKHSSSYLQRLSHSRPSTGSSSKQPYKHGRLKSRSDILAAIDKSAAHKGDIAPGGYDASNSHVLLVARQHAAQLQQQNDALVRVLERERQQHEKTKQQVQDVQFELKECRAEREVAIQVLRQDNAGLTAQLRKVLAGSDHQEVLDAYDSALAASAAKVQEAQEAAAALAAQLTDTELQLQQLHHACSNSALLGVARGLESDLGTGIIGSDAAAVAMAVAAAGGRCKNSKSPTRSKHAAALPADLECSRGMRALRQHQKHLEQQLSKQQQDVTRLQRENLKLLRYKKQWTTAVSRLQGATAAQEAAAAAAEEAGLRAAAANGRADRLQQQVDSLTQENQQMHTAEQALQQQLQLVQDQLQQLQQQVRVSNTVDHTTITVQDLAGVHTPVKQTALAEAQPAAASQEVAVAAPGQQQAGTVTRANGGTVAGQSPAAVVAGTALSDRAIAALEAQGSSSPAVRRSQTVRVRGADNAHAVADNGISPAKQSLRHSMSVPSRPAADAGSEALSLAHQVSRALPAEPRVQQQLASLMSAIAAGIEERKALAEQGQLLLGMVVGKT